MELQSYIKDSRLWDTTKAHAKSHKGATQSILALAGEAN
jgi:hypothetical protein